MHIYFVHTVLKNVKTVEPIFFEILALSDSVFFLHSDGLNFYLVDRKLVVRINRRRSGSRSALIYNLNIAVFFSFNVFEVEGGSAAALTSLCRKSRITDRSFLISAFLVLSTISSQRNIIDLGRIGLESCILSGCLFRIELNRPLFLYRWTLHGFWFIQRISLNI